MFVDEFPARTSGHPSLGKYLGYDVHSMKGNSKLLGCNVHWNKTNVTVRVPDYLHSDLVQLHILHFYIPCHWDHELHSRDYFHLYNHYFCSPGGCSQ